MRKYFTFIFFLFILTIFSCNKKYGNPVEDPHEVLSSLMNFLVYRAKYVDLSGDFNALNVASNPISKQEFLHLLTLGKYLPLRLVSKDSLGYYKLYEMNDKTDSEIQETIKNWADVEYKYYSMEGMELPDFNFTDLNNNTYNKKTIKGKILVINCWFIGCSPCVAEFPELNNLVEKYKNKRDIVFVGLAPNPKNALQEFLTNKEFKYSVIPLQRSYVVDSLKIFMFPTHLIVDKNGKIYKVTDNYKELAYALKKLTAKTTLNF